MKRVVRVLACCGLAVFLFWCFAILGIVCGGSIKCERVWDSFWLVLSPVFAYLTIYKPRIAVAYALALVITVLLLVAEAAASQRLGKVGALSSPYVFWPCLAANFAFGVWLTRSRHRWRSARKLADEGSKTD
jgi:hypothetical protein